MWGCRKGAVGTYAQAATWEKGWVFTALLSGPDCKEQLPGKMTGLV